jgi:Nitrogen regulatory protein P-II
MKGVMLITEPDTMAEFERALLAGAHTGFTILPAVAGSGRHGLKTGDRIHPGGSSLLLTIVADGELVALLALLRRVRDAAKAGETTRIWTFPAEEVA